ncbi:MAG: L-ribulose-5-phosphate 4-epimerase AraD [Bacteroidales bacterium]|nr:L-ribulose-5-phosphate 4-epimerase AraD [Bacteroidales bacterium]
MSAKDKYNNLQGEVFRANQDLVNLDLVKLSWGNASAVDRARSVMYIKPSGVDYSSMLPEQMVEVDLSTGEYMGELKPSSDTATHLFLYRHFTDINGIVHTHSSWATIWAQASLEIPCMGTTHADHFFGAVPVTRQLYPEEIKKDYEKNTGAAIIERFAGMSALEMPGVLVANHGPFTWGTSVKEAVEHALILEEIAKMAYYTRVLGKSDSIPNALLEKHYWRKHGSGASYGQKNK